MQSRARKHPLWSLEKSVVVLFIAVLLGLGSLVAYYYWERQAQPRVALIEREAQQLEARVRSDPQNADARLGTANTYLQRGMYDRAIEQYQEALILRDNDIVALLGLGAAYMLKGQNNEAITYFEQVVGLNGDSEFAQIDKRLATAYFYLGKIHLESGQLDDASQYLAEARNIDRTNADYVYLSAVASQKQGNDTEAIQLFGRALSFDPAFTEAYQGLAASYKASGDTNKAAYAEAMGILFSGNVDGAVGRLKSLATANADADTFWGLGWAYERQDQRDEAIKAYGRALDVNPQHMLARSSLSRLENSR